MKLPSNGNEREEVTLFGSALFPIRRLRAGEKFFIFGIFLFFASFMGAIIENSCEEATGLCGWMQAVTICCFIGGVFCWIVAAIVTLMRHGLEGRY